MEDAFAIAKRLLGMAYFYGGAQNAVELQLWATWILYAVLVDLTDAVAEALRRPFAEISMEMVYRSCTSSSAPNNRIPRSTPCAIWPSTPSRWASSNVHASRLNKRLRLHWILLDMMTNPLTCNGCPKIVPFWILTGYDGSM